MSNTTEKKRSANYNPDAICHLPKDNVIRRELKKTGNIKYYDTRGKYITLINTAIKKYQIIEKPDFTTITTDEIEALAKTVKELVVLKRMNDLKNNRR